MTVTAPRDLLTDVAQAAETATGVRAVVDRAPAEWRTDGAAFITVTAVTELAPELTGDGGTLVDGFTVQVSLWEQRDDETPARVTNLVTALDGSGVAGRAMHGGVQGVFRLPDPDTDLIQHATTVRYPLPR